MMLARITHGLWLAAGRRHWRAFRRALRDPERTQQAYLAALLKRQADTAFGSEHHFSDITSARAFQSRVPIRRYDAFIPWIDRIRAGERAVLTREPVRRLIPSSGSTAASKLIPYTTALQREFNRAIAPWINDLYGTFATLKSGPAYWSISPATPMPHAPDSAVPIGFDTDSQYLGGWCAALVDRVLLRPDELRGVHDADTFRYLTMLSLLRARELRLVSVWHPSFFTLLLEFAEHHWDRLCRDIAAGTMTPPRGAPNLSPRQCRADPSRALQLERLGPGAWQHIWPKLAVVSCWTAAHAAPAARELATRLPHVTMQGKGLIATEAFVTLPFRGRSPLAVRSHFFEFLDDSGQPRLAHELECGQSYEMIVTTGGGLYRYRLGDLVYVDGMVNGTPSLVFIGRADRVSDHVGEKLSDGMVAEVLATLLQPLPRIRFAMLAPERPPEAFPEVPPAGAWRYVLYLESPEPLPADLGDRLEAGLLRNIHYQYAVQLGQLRPAIVRPVASGGARAYTERLAAQGIKLGDIKPIALSDQDGWQHWLPVK